MVTMITELAIHDNNSLDLIFIFTLLLLLCQQSRKYTVSSPTKDYEFDLIHTLLSVL